MRIVTAQDLELWADNQAAKAALPELVASLIRASCPSLQSYRFPSGDASQMHGFDGVADVSEGNVFVPDGLSIWECGAGKDYKGKASADYEKRTRQLSLEERSQYTFIFVTPRKWDTGLEEWRLERSGDGWLKVTVYDAVSLEHWLDENPAVGLSLAKDLGIIPRDGVRTVQDFWEEYRRGFDPPLREELLLSGREGRAKQLCEALAAGLRDLSKWRADSAMEAAAFIVAAIMRAEPELSRFLAAKTLFLDTLAAARTVPTKNRFIFILLPELSGVAPALARTSQVILVLGGDNRADETESLERMKTTEFAAGLKSMGLPEAEAFQLSMTCGRSLTVLSRLKASAIAQRPKWHDDSKLVPMVLTGGWDASNDHDCAIVAKLCNASYEIVDADARRLSSLADAPLDLEGSVWTLRSATDAFTLVGCLVDTATQGRLREACIEVFSERDRRLDVPDDARPIIPIRGDDFQHSEWLRRGLARTLLLISELHQAAGFRVIGRTPEQYVDSIVGSLPRLSEDIGVLVSLKFELPRLAEAAPRPLASALEHLLEGDGERWSSVVFRDKKDQSWLGATSPHTYLLWALETMAWNPEFFPRAASLLMTLAEFDPGGKLANRPLKSLREIFLAWRPNTYASLDERIVILRSVCQKHPKVGLPLAMSLLPVSHDVSMGTAKPGLRDFGEAKSKPTTVADVRRAYQECADIVVDLAGIDITGLTAIIETLPHLDDATRERVTAAIRRAAENAGSDAVFPIWSKLRTFIGRHQYFHDANWALKPEQLKPLEELRDAIRPSNPVRQIQWLFDEYFPREGEPHKTDYIGEANRDRSEALRTLLEEGGISAVLDLARATRLPYFVGIALVESGADIGVAEEAVSLAIAPDSGVSMDFTMALSSVAHEKYGSPWDTWIASVARTLDSAVAASLLLRWTESRQTWNFAAALSPDIEREFWTQKPAFRPNSEEDIEFAFGKYAEVGRFTAILDMVGYREDVLTTAQCVQVLQGLAGELSKDPRKMQRAVHELVHTIQVLQQRQDVDFGQLAALEYQYLPILEFQAEPVALARLLTTSPRFFVSVVCDAFARATAEKEEVTEERRSRASLAYRLLRSIKTVPGFSAESADVNHLRSWISEARRLASAEDRAIIADQQIGQILAYAPADANDAVWPAKPIRDLIEELAAKEIETGIAISRFNQRGAFSKALYDGGEQERGFASQYRAWAEAVRTWPRTSALLRQIADYWDTQAQHADREAELDQLRDS